MGQSNQKIKRPVPVKIYNAIGRSLKFQAPWSNLDENDLVKSARKKTGLNDFGDESFMEPFRILLKSVKEEARLHSFGRLMLRIRMLDILSTRLRVEHLIAKYPEINEIELSPITLITGLQRTGTTKLHRLLSKDPDNRTLVSWEVLSPVPVEMKSHKTIDPRIKDAKFKENFIRYISPEFFKVHAVLHDAPEEEILLLDNAFLSTTPEAMFHVPAYASWLEKQDQVPAYEYLKKQLKLLQWQRKEKRWILKTPHHLEFLPALTKVFPEIKIIQTHRDPRKTLGSMCSLVQQTRSMFSDEVDLNAIGQHWARKTGLMVNNGLDFRQTDEQIPFLDISYYDLIKDTENEMMKIYKFMNAEMTTKAKEAMSKALKINVKNKYGRHKYSLEDYGLNNEIIDPVFKRYRDYFSIQFE